MIGHSVVVISLGAGAEWWKIPLGLLMAFLSVEGGREKKREASDQSASTTLMSGAGGGLHKWGFQSWNSVEERVLFSPSMLKWQRRSATMQGTKRPAEASSDVPPKKISRYSFGSYL